MSKINEHFQEIEDKTKVCYAVAEQARQKGLDPMSKVEVPLAATLAEKATGLIATIYPQVNNKQIVNRILELEKEFGKLDPAVYFKIAEEVAKEKFCKFSSLLEAMDAGIRIGFAYITLGVVSSPIEGYTGIKLNKTRNNEDYIVAYFSGPIRSAGTTASCIVLMLIDYLREMFGYAKYDPDEKEQKRYVTENYDYHERCNNLQYLPTEEEILFLAKNIPIEISGEPSEQKEVSNFKDLPRVETNLIRGGMCLCFSEGLAQKAQKGLRLWNAAKAKGCQMTGWAFLDDYVKLHKKREKGSTDTSPTYIKDLVAGRPVFGHPSQSGAFRFRYGRSRASGFSANSVHPATMGISDSFLSTGTQLKIEKPTKGCAISSCDGIDGPIVKMKSGSVRYVRDYESAKQLYKDVEEIIYFGDLLVPFGDVANRNYELLKSPYVEEWWYQELKKSERVLNDNADIDNIFEVGFELARNLSLRFGIPLHPKHIFYWNQITKEQFFDLLDWLGHGRMEDKIILPYGKIDRERFAKGKRALELIGLEHEVSIENVVLTRETSLALLANLGVEGVYERELRRVIESVKQIDGKNALDFVKPLSKYRIKDKAGTFIGSRMGRPEKAKLRKLIGSPNVLFPVGEEGGRMRSVNEAHETGFVKAEFPIYYCKKCNKEGIYFKCGCGENCEKLNFCRECKQKFSAEKCREHAIGQAHSPQKVDMKNYFDLAIRQLDLLPDEIPKLIKGVKGTSNKNHTIENLAKGVLRALLNLQVNKDGTIRFDATEMPLTHFKPSEVGVSVSKLFSLGYEKDIHGRELKSEEQILELKPHDVLLPCCPDSQDEKADDVFIRIAHFLDLLLVKFYKMPPFYNIRTREDLVGQMVVCMAPHNCAGVVGRIVGFSKTQTLTASPYMHAGMRRDCLGADSYVSIEKDGNWRIDKIGNIINEINPEVKADNFGTLKKETSLSIWSNPGKAKIKEVTKHAPREIIKLHLEDGRNIEVTESHKIYLKGKLEKRAIELKEGEQLMVNYKREVDETDIEALFLPEIFSEREDIMIRNIRDFLYGIEKLNKHSNFWQRDSFPVKFVKVFLEKHNKCLKDLPEYSKISAKRDNIQLPIRIPLNKELLEVFGFYIAEGYSRKSESKKGFYQVCISSTEKELLDFVKKVFESYFEIKPSENHSDHVTFSSKIIYELFTSYLKMGSRARDKRIPSVFLNLKKDKIASLLRGYYEGDGSASLSDIRVCCNTISEGLKQDLSFVLSRFSIFTKFYEYEKEPGDYIKAFYIKKNRKIPKFKITKIIIPSNFVKNFKEIGFLSERKKNILHKLCEQSPYGMKIDFDDNYVYPKITKIEKIGEKESFCFNVEEAHRFFANDILVHNCDGDEAAVMMLLDVLLNFSREYLPAHRGGTQDAPLVLNTRLRAGEVDDQILDFELVSEYPLDLYEKSEEGGHHSSEIKIETVKTRLALDKDPFTNTGFTHNSSDINAGVLNSSYKLLPTMHDKVDKMMLLVEKLRATNTSDVARLVIERHFIRDIRGNLRKFSQQEFRCSKCNTKYRRPPLVGKCLECGGHIIFTISEGSIVKYLEPALSLANKYNIPAYVKQSMELTKSYIESIFVKEKEKQIELKKYF